MPKIGLDKKCSRWVEEREKSLNELVTVKVKCERDPEKGQLWRDGEEENRGHSRKDSEPCQTELFEEAGIVILSWDAQDYKCYAESFTFSNCCLASFQSVINPVIIFLEPVIKHFSWGLKEIQRMKGETWLSLTYAYVRLSLVIFLKNIVCAQLCPTLYDPVNCTPSGSSVHGTFLGKKSKEGCQFWLQGIFLTQGLNQCLLHWQTDSLPLTPQIYHFKVK